MSELEMSSNFVVMPAEANHYGNVHGGVIMLRADNLAYSIAARYCRTNVVTAKVHEVNFIAPVKLGDLVMMQAKIIRVGNTSLDVDVKIEGEDFSEGHTFDVANAKFTMVSVDDKGRPKPLRCQYDIRDDI